MDDNDDVVFVSQSVRSGRDQVNEVAHQVRKRGQATNNQVYELRTRAIDRPFAPDQEPIAAHKDKRQKRSTDLGFAVKEGFVIRTPLSGSSATRPAEVKQYSPRVAKSQAFWRNQQSNAQKEMESMQSYTTELKVDNPHLKQLNASLNQNKTAMKVELELLREQNAKLLLEFSNKNIQIEALQDAKNTRAHISLLIRDRDQQELPAGKCTTKPRLRPAQEENRNQKKQMKSSCKNDPRQGRVQKESEDNDYFRKKLALAKEIKELQKTQKKKESESKKENRSLRNDRAALRHRINELEVLNISSKTYLSGMFKHYNCLYEKNVTLLKRLKGIADAMTASKKVNKGLEGLVGASLEELFEYKRHFWKANEVKQE